MANIHNNYMYWNDRNQLPLNQRLKVMKSINQPLMKHFSLKTVLGDEKLDRVAHQYNVPNYMRFMEEKNPRNVVNTTAQFFDRFNKPSDYDLQMREMQERISRTNLFEQLRSMNPQTEQMKQQYLSQEDKKTILELLNSCIKMYLQYFTEKDKHTNASHLFEIISSFDKLSRFYNDKFYALQQDNGFVYQFILQLTKLQDLNVKIVADFENKLTSFYRDTRMYSKGYFKGIFLDIGKVISSMEKGHNIGPHLADNTLYNTNLVMSELPDDDDNNDDDNDDTGHRTPVALTKEEIEELTTRKQEIEEEINTQKEQEAMTVAYKNEINRKLAGLTVKLGMTGSNSEQIQEETDQLNTQLDEYDDYLHSIKQSVKALRTQLSGINELLEPVPFDLGDEAETQRREVMEQKMKTPRQVQDINDEQVARELEEQGQDVPFHSARKLETPDIRRRVDPQDLNAEKPASGFFNRVSRGISGLLLPKVVEDYDDEEAPPESVSEEEKDGEIALDAPIPDKEPDISFVKEKTPAKQKGKAPEEKPARATRGKSKAEVDALNATETTANNLLKDASFLGPITKGDYYSSIGKTQKKPSEQLKKDISDVYFTHNLNDTISKQAMKQANWKTVAIDDIAQIYLNLRDKQRPMLKKLNEAGYTDAQILNSERMRDVIRSLTTFTKRDFEKANPVYKTVRGDLMSKALGLFYKN